MKITEPGVYDIPADDYHRDPCPEPSLSSSIAKLLVDATPMHAKAKHPRLTVGAVVENKREFDIGSAAHQLVLGDVDRIVAHGFDDYRKKEAQEVRDAAWKAGKIPLKPKEMRAVQAMHAAAEKQIAAHKEAAGAFHDGHPERTLVWREGAAWCRARLDWLPGILNVFYDYKTTTDASPDAWGGRQLFNLGFDMQVGFYRRGIHAVLKRHDPQVRFIVQEIEPPYALSVIGLSPTALAFADMRAAKAVKIWQQCMAADRWPGYPDRTAYVDAPVWREKQWAEVQERERMLAEFGDWQAPIKAGGQ
jgi:PDDEXK-like domain of unknown function (DUF3799)